ncbi:hypothetical protein C8F04DRAFT_1266691 [Mycena alexandri]|uniref:Uncharacterized protein n=1 Tax=Mycena alexandri TaxID=1745969 RepID=A0AAD6WWE5_9AGAR|nr:hypothetical protein C8F04DRAFT_1266691 [Mycena alexandri]
MPLGSLSRPNGPANLQRGLERLQRGERHASMHFPGFSARFDPVVPLSFDPQARQIGSSYLLKISCISPTTDSPVDDRSPATAATVEAGHADSGNCNTDPAAHDSLQHRMKTREIPRPVLIHRLAMWPPNVGGNMASSSKCTPAQLQAMRAYRERYQRLCRPAALLNFNRNTEQLRAKARERMARCGRFIQLKEGETADTDQYRARARASSQRHRERYRDALANAQRVRRARKYIKDHGFNEWARRYDKKYIAAHGHDVWVAAHPIRASTPTSPDLEDPASSPSTLMPQPDDSDWELND